jgi:hypothetical protein
VISADRRIPKNRAEYQAFRNSNLIGLFLSQGLYKAPVIKQTERILALWPNIVTVCQSIQGGAMFELCNAAAAALANRRTSEFLHQQLR